MPVPPGSPPRKPQPTSGLFHFVNNKGTKHPVKPAGRHAVALGPPQLASSLIKSHAETRRYYFVLVGEVLRNNGGNTQFVGECMYVLVKADELAHSAAEWFRTANFVAETTIKMDLGIQGRISGVMGGFVKGTADINVVKADLFTLKTDLTRLNKSEAWDWNYAGENGSTKISNGLSLSAEIPFIPKTAWGKLAAGGMYEQSQLIDGDLLSNDFKQDWGVYAIVPILQPKALQNVKKTMEGHPNMAMGKSPSIGNKTGKNKDFYGADLGVGAALIVGADVRFKIGVTKK